MKGFVLLGLVALVCTALAPREAMKKQKLKVPITLEIVSETKLKIIRTKMEPEEIIPGGSISIKIQYQALEDVSIKDLYVVAKLNGVEAFTDQKDIKKEYEEGDKDTISYEISIPAFCPPGDYQIFLNIRENESSNAAVLKAHFAF